MIKSLILVGAGLACLMAGLHFHFNREIAALQKDYENQGARAAELNREAALERARLEQEQGENAAGADYEALHTANVATIAAEQKKIELLIDEWPKVDAERQETVKAVREQETKRPPYTLTLADGTKLENFVIRSLPDEKTISAEHSSGIVKLAVDKLPDDLKEKLGLGWKPEPPARLEFDREGNAVVKQAIRQLDEKEAINDTARELNIELPDTNTMGGVTRALAIIEARLAKTQSAFDAERANARKLAMFKPNLTGPGGKTYAVLGKESNDRLVALAGQLTNLRTERSKLQHKLKSF
jgi:hypothetical protein